MLIESIKEPIVLLSDSTWNVEPVLFEIKFACAIGPPSLLVLKESPYCRRGTSVDFSYGARRLKKLLQNRVGTDLKILPRRLARTRTEILDLRHHSQSIQDIRYHTL